MQTTLEPTLDDATVVTDLPVAWETITPAMAVAYLARNPSNRNTRLRVVNAYARDMEHGAWLPTGETIKFSQEGELLDGQHRLLAIIESGRPQRLLVVRGLDRRAQTVVDSGAMRTSADALRMAGLGARNPIALASAARLLILWRSGRLTRMDAGMRNADRVTHQEVLEAVRDEPDLVDAMETATRDYSRTGIPAGPGAMMQVVLAGVDAVDAERFFDSLAGYSTDGPKDPRAVLLHTIRQMRVDGQLRRPGEAIGVTFTAWNAWRDGQVITSLPTRDSRGRVLTIPEPV